jgi:hypothetical protein
MQNTKKNSFFICRFLEIKLPLKVKRSFPSTSLNPKKKNQTKHKGKIWFFILFFIFFIFSFIFIIYYFYFGRVSPNGLNRSDRPDQVDSVGLTRSSRHRNKPKKTETKIDQKLQKHKNLKNFQSKRIKA